MIKLSDRMQAVADLAAGYAAGADTDLTIADIGCDHAYVSICLVENGVYNRAIAMDLRPGPLKIAEENISLYGLSSKIEIRLSNGFERLRINEAACAIIAGMGGPLMLDILRAGAMHTNSGIGLVLQPQSDVDRVREYIYEIGYELQEERMLIDEGKYYTVMRAVPATAPIKPYSRSELCFGRRLIEDKAPVLHDYLEKKLHKNHELMDELGHILSDKTRRRFKELEAQNELIEECLRSFEAE